MTNIKTHKTPKQYNCEDCNFICSNKKDYNRHILTAKHKIRSNTNGITQKTPKIYECICGRRYSHSSSLWNHKRACSDQPKNAVDVYNNDTPNQDNQFVSIMETLIKENQDFKQLLIEQSSQMMELAKNSQTINNNNNNTTNNNQFNLNFFLNDTCKDAMNITDFLSNLDVQLNEIEYIGHHGYVNGMTKMIMERLKGMDITKRPIHCTDIKRETMYIKDKDEWSRDTDELTKLRKILNRVTMNNCKTIPKWKAAHPDCEVMETRNNEFCYKMMRLMLGDVEDAQIKLDNKIIKTMTKDLFCK